jgi:hypothetical protein
MAIWWDFSRDPRWMMDDRWMIENMMGDRKIHRLG